MEKAYLKLEEMWKRESAPAPYVRSEEPLPRESSPHLVVAHTVSGSESQKVLESKLNKEPKKKKICTQPLAFCDLCNHNIPAASLKAHKLEKHGVGGKHAEKNRAKAAAKRNKK